MHNVLLFLTCIFEEFRWALAFNRIVFSENDMETESASSSASSVGQPKPDFSAFHKIFSNLDFAKLAAVKRNGHHQPMLFVSEKLMNHIFEVLENL